MPATPLDPAALTAAIRRRVAALRPANASNLRALRHEISRQIAYADPRAVLDLADRLLEGGGIGHRFLAYELVCHHAAALAGLGEPELLRLGRGLDSWAAVDCFACRVSTCFCSLSTCA